ncbi:MAG: hypothetical protein E6767_01620 [Dysgonomonas sp.]|nr:hypothetical protein [Dysgonomonas sp.]
MSQLADMPMCQCREAVKNRLCLRFIGFEIRKDSENEELFDNYLSI